MKIEAVVYDLDGTILNSKDLRIQAWKHAFEVYGVDLSENDIAPLIGLPGPDLAGRYSRQAFEIEMEEENYFRKNLQELKLYDDVDSTFRKLNSAGIETGIVTSSRKALVNILKIPYAPIITIDDVQMGKPDPEPYLKILDILKVKPGNAMFVGDAVTDLMPAREIGSVSVYVGHGRKLDSEFADYSVEEIKETAELVEKLNS